MRLAIEIVTYGETLFARIFDRWTSSPIFNNMLKMVAAFIVGVLTDIRVYIVCIVILVWMDVFSGIGASLKRGERFKSKKIKRGLLERVILYGSLTIITLCLDSVIRGVVDYGSYYITVFCCSIISFYEAGSTIENLIEIYPKFTFLRKLARLLNIIEKKYESNTVGHVEEILKTKLDDDEK